MDEAGAGEPDADERGHQLAQSNAVGRLEHVEILQHVGDGHQTQRTSEPQTLSHHKDTRASTTLSRFGMDASNITFSPINQSIKQSNKR